jgi:hypothetical protein
MDDEGLCIREGKCLISNVFTLTSLNLFFESATNLNLYVFKCAVILLTIFLKYLDTCFGIMRQIQIRNSIYMEAKEEFKKLMEEICDIVFRETAIPKGSKFEIPLITKNVLHMLMNLNHQIEEQREEIKRFEEHITKLDEKIKLLINELKSLGYLNIKERRKPLRRTIVTQEAFTNLLRSKGIITRKELLDEIKQLLKKHY